MNIATIKTFITSAWGKWVILLSGFLALGVAAGLYILTQGLAATNLTDLVPWGLWIAVDLSSIAIAGGAFFLCAGVYLLGLKKYEPVARTATFIGLAGYTMAMFAAHARYWPAGPLLACPGLLEQALPALGSDHVRDALPDGVAF